MIYNKFKQYKYKADKRLERLVNSRTLISILMTLFFSLIIAIVSLLKKEDENIIVGILNSVFYSLIFYYVVFICLTLIEHSFNIKKIVYKNIKKVHILEKDVTFLSAFSFMIIDLIVLMMEIATRDNKGSKWFRITLFLTYILLVYINCSFMLKLDKQIEVERESINKF